MFITSSKVCPILPLASTLPPCDGVALYCIRRAPSGAMFQNLSI